MKLRVLFLYCEKIEECRRFYSALGFVFTAERQYASPVYYVGICDSDLIIELRPVWRSYVHMTLYFEHYELGRLVANLVNAGFKYMLMKHSNNVLVQIALNDPDGRRIIIEKT